MIEFLIAAIVCVVLNLFLLYRIFRGPTAADRMCAADALDLVWPGDLSGHRSGGGPPGLCGHRLCGPLSGREAVSDAHCH